jgi:EAL domain-containing protein (putative c-di-GMP-specific phosphodiesterase class I)
LDPDEGAIVTAIVAMAKSLGLDVVAEGVETEDQSRFLLERGCNEMQGYLVSPPVPADTMWSLLGISGASPREEREAVI